MLRFARDNLLCHPLSLVQRFVSVSFEGRRYEISSKKFQFRTFGRNGLIVVAVYGGYCIKSMMEQSKVETGNRRETVFVKVVYIAVLYRNFTRKRVKRNV
jgi:hypothetical protein